MNLRAKAFERALRPLVRAAVASSPALLKEYRRLRRGRQYQMPSWMRRLGFSVVFVALFAGVPASGRPLPWALTALTFWFTGSCLWYALRLGHALFQSKDLLVYHHWPLLDHEVFLVQWRKHVRQSGLMLLHAVPVYFLLGRNAGPWWVVAAVSLLLGFMQTVMVLSLGCLALRWLPQLLLLAGGVAFSGLALAMLLFHIFAATWETGMSRAASLLPTGWMQYLFLHGFIQGDHWSWCLLLPAGLVGATVAYSQRKLREAYSLDEPGMMPTAPPETEAEDVVNDAIYTHRGVTELEDSIRERRFLFAETWREDGWIEKLASRWLRGREDVVADFLVGNSLGATHSLNRAIKVAAVGAIAIWFFGQVSGWIMYLPLVLVGILALPLLDGGGRGMRMLFLGSGYSPAFAGFPISGGEIISVLLKLNVVRCVVAAPLALVMGTVVGIKLQLGWAEGLFWGLKIWALTLVLQPMFILLRIFNATSSSERIRWSQLIIALPVLIVLFGLAAKFLFTGTALAALSWLGGVTVMSMVITWLYSRAFGRSRFDLLRQTSGEDS